MRYVKQLIYGVFYLALWSGLVAGIYFWHRPVASCFNNAKDRNEAGVDCGGVCARVCIPQAILPVEVVGAARLIPIAAPSSTPHATLVAEIRNRNGEFGASSFDYAFQVFDSGGSVVASLPGQSFIYPGEIKYLVMPNMALPAGAAASYAKATFSEPQWTSADRFPRPLLVIQTANTATENGNLVVRGTLANQDSLAFPSVELTALFRDAAGNVVGASATRLQQAVPGASREFSMFHPVIEAAAPDKTQVFVTAFNPR